MFLRKSTRLGLTDICNLFFAAYLVALVAFVLWLPAFPSGDGPLHAYYAHIYGVLAAGNKDSLYASYYSLRHIVQPYCLHYMFLTLAARWVSPLKGEEYFVAIILINTALGFRYMASRYGISAPFVSLFLLPLLLDWSLGAGFLNFCFGVGLLFWAIGIWNNFTSANSTRLLLAYACILLLLTLAHPVPLLVLLFLICGDTVLLAYLEHAQSGKWIPPILRKQYVAIVLTFVAILIPASIADKGKVTSVWRDAFPHRSVFMHFIEVHTLGFFAGGHGVIPIYSALLFLIIPMSIALLLPAASERWSQRKVLPADRQMLLMLLFLLGTLTMPRTVGGGANFSERMWDIVWPIILAAAAGASLKKSRQKLLFWTGTLFTVFAALVTAPRLHSLSETHALLSQVSLPTGHAGLLLEPFSTTSVADDSSYPLFWWSGARAFEASNAILLNSPWLDQSQIPITAGGPNRLAGSYLRTSSMEQPAYLTRDIAAGYPPAIQALHNASFFLYATPNDTGAAMQEISTILKNDLSRWSCHVQHIATVCVRREISPQ